MNSHRFTHTNAKYKVAALSTITAEHITFEELQTFFNKANEFAKLIDDRQSDIWQNFRIKLRRIGWNLLTVPLPLNDSQLALARSATELAEMAELNRYSTDGPISQSALQLVTTLRNLSALNIDPLGDQCWTILQTGNIRKSALLIIDGKFIEPIKRSWKDYNQSPVVLTPKRTRGSTIYETMVVVGASRWYNSSIFNAPKAENICIIRYSWLRDNNEVLYPLPHSGKPSLPIRSSQLHTPINNHTFFEPIIDWYEIIESNRGLDHLTHQSNNEQFDERRARLFLLSNRHAIFLQTEDGAKILTVDPNSDDGLKIERTAVNALVDGDFIVVRKEQSEIQALESAANQILGRQADQLRTSQKRWKSLLRKKTLQFDTSVLINQLKSMGLGVDNIRYWLTPHTLKTQNKQDFQILMQYLEIGDEAENIWQEMSTIANAHLRAGMRFRKELIKSIKKIDITQLIREGQIDIALGNEESGTLRIVQVVARNTETTHIPNNKIGIVFKVKTDLWLG
jgi:hypothetical protein